MVKYFQFPTGEMHCKGELCGDLLYISFNREYSINDYIMQILLAASVHKPKILFLPYLPYSRQDRPNPEDRTEPLSLKVMGNLLNSANFEKVITLDVHSDAAFSCVNNLVNIPIEYIIPSHLASEQTLVIPDIGAQKRLKRCLSSFKDHVIALKDRDMNTGMVTINGLIGDVYGKSCFIVDDICDGGATFIQLAQVLKEKGATSVELFVTHGVFTKGTQRLRVAGINRIHTTDSFIQRYGPDGVDGMISCGDILKKELNR